MTVRIVPVPPYRSCAYRDDDVLPVQKLSHFGGAKAAGVKPPGVFVLVLGSSTEPDFHGSGVNIEFCIEILYDV